MARTLQTIKQELDTLKAQLGVAQIKRNEVLGALKNSYGINTAKEAEAEQVKLTGTVIPKLEADRDSLIQSAEEVLDGITGLDTGGHPGEQAGPAGSGQPGGGAQGRTIVGRNR
jgi:hypothetical protein